MTVIARMNVGGPAKLIHYLDDYLVKSGFEHILVTGYCEANEIDFLASHEIKGKVFRLAKTQRSINLFRDLRSIFDLIQIIKREKPDVIHTHTAKAGLIGRVASLFSQQKNIKNVHTYHGHLLYGYFRGINSFIFNNIEKFLAKKTDILIAVSLRVKNDLIHSGIGKKSKWLVIYPGIEKSAEISTSENENSVLNLLWVGRFSKVKNPMLAIKSFELMQVKGNVKLTMVGGGELLDDCVKYSMTQNLGINFVGWDTDIYKYLVIADLLLLTSLNEGLPLVVLEAASLKVPTLATNVGGVGEFIINDETGFLSDNTLESYSEYLAEAIKKPEKIEVLGTNAFNKVNKEFNLEDFCTQHITLYKSLIN